MHVKYSSVLHEETSKVGLLYCVCVCVFLHAWKCTWGYVLRFEF